MRRLLLGGCVVLATACGEASRRCDQAALAAAASEADTLMRTWSPRDARPPDHRRAILGLRRACPTLPAGFHGYLEHAVFPRPQLRGHQLDLGTPLHEDAEALAPLKRHCPAYARTMDAVSEAPAHARIAALYDGCALDGLEVVGRDELSPIGEAQARHGHALYLWLRDVGAAHEVARALVRPIVAGADYALDMPEDLQLPAVERGEAVALDDGIQLYVTRMGVTLDGRRLVTFAGDAIAAQDLDRGLVGALHDALVEELDKRRQLARRRGLDQPTRVTLLIDPSLPWRSAGPVVWTAARSGVDGLDLRGLAPDPMRPVRTLPLLSAGAPQGATAQLSADAASFQCADASPRALELAAVPDALAGCDGAGLRLHVAPDTTWQQVVALAVALAGRGTIAAIEPP